MKNFATNMRAGFSLIEVVVALGVTTFCVMTLMALLAVGINSDKTTVQRSLAANIADAVMADLRATPLANQSYVPTETLYSPRFRFMLPATLTGTQTVYVAADGTPLTALNMNLSTANLSSGAGTFRVSISGPLRPSGTAQRTASPVYVLITWPGQADATAATWPSHYAGSFEVVTYLDQN